MFPPVESADEYGVVAVGIELSSWALISAYSRGIFPWPHEGFPMLWFCPSRRCVLFFDELHVGSRLRRFLRKSPFEIRFNSAFDLVMQRCSEPRRCDGEWEPHSWIGPEMKTAYSELHTLGFAHSVEAWRNDELVGGLYGVNLGAYFAGESMFTRADNASKVCILALVELLASRGILWLDCQTLTPHFEKLGAREISRSQFLQLHHKAVHRAIKPFAVAPKSQGQLQTLDLKLPPETSQ